MKGFIAVDENVVELGVIFDVNEYPQQLIAAVTYKNSEVLFPLNEEVIADIDVVKGTVTIDFPDGLF